MAHQEKCMKCKGTGKIPCSNCGGKGYEASRYFTIDGKMPCQRCNGSKVEECPKCHGDGYLILSDL